MTDLVPAAPLFALIERLATDNDIPVDKLERMLAMKERLDAEQARKDFNDALARCQQIIPQIIKTRDNTQTRSKYADLADILEIAQPIVTEHGMSTRFYPSASKLEGHYGIDCVLAHTGGHSEAYHADMPADGAGFKGTANKTAVHGFGSTMSYGRRYLFCMIFNIATRDDDDGNAGRGRRAEISAAQYLALRALLDEVKADEAKFLQHYGALSLEAFPPGRYLEATLALQAKRAGSPAGRRSASQTGEEPIPGVEDAETVEGASVEGGSE